MQISIPDDSYNKLNERAIAAGYADATALIEALAREPTEDPRALLDEDSLRASVEQLARADDAIDEGQGLDATAAAKRIADKHGFSVEG